MKKVLIGLLSFVFVYQVVFVEYCYRLGKPIDGVQGIACVIKEVGNSK